MNDNRKALSGEIYRKRRELNYHEMAAEHLRRELNVLILQREVLREIEAAKCDASTSEATELLTEQRLSTLEAEKRSVV